MSVLRPGWLLCRCGGDGGVRAAGRAGHRPARIRGPAVAAGVALTLSCAALSGLTRTASPGFVALAFSLFGAGAGLASPVITYGSCRASRGSRRALPPASIPAVGSSASPSASRSPGPSWPDRCTARCGPGSPTPPRPAGGSWPAAVRRVPGRAGQHLGLGPGDRCPPGRPGSRPPVTGPEPSRSLTWALPGRARDAGRLRRHLLSPGGRS